MRLCAAIRSRRNPHKNIAEKCLYRRHTTCCIGRDNNRGGLPMLVTMLRISVGLLLWLSVCTYAASPNVAFFYGSNPPWDELRAFDIVVVEPEHAGIDPKQYSSGTTQVYAYVSVGEVE